MRTLIVLLTLFATGLCAQDTARTKADALAAKLKDAKFDEVHATLGEGLQNRLKLHKVRVLEAIDAGETNAAEISAYYADKRGAADLKLDTREQVAALSEGRFATLELGLGLLDKPRLARGFLMVDQAEGQRLSDNFKMFVEGAVIEYENASRDTLRVDLCKNNGVWTIAAFTLVVADAEAGSPLLEASRWSRQDYNSGALAEGKQILGSLRDRVRVHYSKTGALPLTLAEAGVERRDYEGDYYNRCAISAGSTETEAIIYAWPKAGENLPVQAVHFAVATGDSSYKEIRVEEAPSYETVIAAAEATRPDAMAFYRTVGNYYLMKMTMSGEGLDPFISYSKSEVIEVHDTYAMIRYTSLDKDKKELEGVDPYEMRMDFVAPGVTPDPAYKPEILGHEDVEIAGVKYSCEKSESGSMTMWMYKGLMLKYVGDGFEGLVEEFKFK